MRRIKLMLLIGGVLLALTGVVYGAIFPVIVGAGVNADAPIVGGPASVTFRHLTTTPGDVGAWHYHPGYVHNVVTQDPLQ